MVYEIKLRADNSLVGTTDDPNWIKFNKATDTWVNTDADSAEAIAFDSTVYDFETVVVSSRDSGGYIREVEVTEETDNTDTMLGLAELSEMIADLEARVAALEKK